MSISHKFKNPVKATFVNCSDIKTHFSSSHCVVGISVGQKAFEGDYLRSLLNLISRNFASCTILVGDTLQRHNLYFSNKKYEDSIMGGDEWLIRNSQVISNLNIANSIDRWDRWLTSELFLPSLKIVTEVYNNNIIFFSAVQNTIEEFYQRVMSRKKIIIEKEYFFEMSKNYLLEEIAVLKLMLPKEKYHYFVYPNKISSALDSAYTIFVKNLYPGKLKWVHVQLKRK